MMKDPRDAEALRRHYEIETALADRLRSASPEQRAGVYGEVYDELFSSVPEFFAAIAPRTEQSESVRFGLAYTLPLLSADKTFLEIGTGDGVMSFAVAPHVACVYGLDVSDVNLLRDRAPANFSFIKSPDGISIPLPTESVDVAFSNQLMEHLHPDDAAGQVAEILRVLKPGGFYRLSTPSRHTGPHDISGYFDFEASGFHLREYDYPSLKELFIRAGFSKPKLLLCGQGRQASLPYVVGRAAEVIMSALPRPLAARAARNKIVRGLTGINLVAAKPVRR